MAVKRRPAGYRSARAGRAGRPARAAGGSSVVIKIYFGYEIQNSEPNSLTPS